MNSAGNIVMECVIETKASVLLQFFNGLLGDVRVTFEEGTWAAWLYDLLEPRVSEVVVCNPRRNALLKDGSKSDRIDARKLVELLRGNHLKSVYHGEHGLRTLKELARSYLTITKDVTRVMNGLKALYRSWGIGVGVNCTLTETVGSEQNYYSCWRRCQTSSPNPKKYSKDWKLRISWIDFRNAFTGLRRILELRYVFGLSIRETAKNLGLSGGTAKAQLCRAQITSNNGGGRLWMKSTLTSERSPTGKSHRASSESVFAQSQSRHPVVFVFLRPHDDFPVRGHYSRRTSEGR
jgi:hypothetical protein